MDARTRDRLVSRRERRRSTNVFSGISQAKIQMFREVFNMIDQDGDGHISKEDLRDILSSLGKNPSEELIEEMMSHGPGGPINFTSFLAMFVNRTAQTDSKDDIECALMLIDKDGTGLLDAREFAMLLHSFGMDRLTEEEIAVLLRKAPINEDGLLDLKEFAKMLTFENVMVNTEES